MSTRNISPVFNHQTENSLSTLSKIALPSRVARKGPKTSQARDGSRVSRRSHIANNNEALWDEDQKEGRLDVEPNIQENTTMLGLAAHDLRHPAAALAMYSELLKEAIGDIVNEEQMELIDSIRSVSQFLIRLLDDTLDLVHAESGELRLSAEPVTLAGIVEQSVSMSRPVAEQRKIDLHLTQDGEPLPVLLDAVKICKVFNNLIENAIRYCNPGARIDIRIFRAGNRVVVSVRDDGPGIPPEVLKNLFIPFRSTLSRAHSEEPGTGLGLAIAKHTVRLHDGRIWVKSKVGKGTTFYVSLPAQDYQGSRPS